MKRPFNRDRLIFFVSVAAFFCLGLLLFSFGNYLTSLAHGTLFEFPASFVRTAGEVIGVFAVLTLFSERLIVETLLKSFTEMVAANIRQLIFTDHPGIVTAGLRGIVPEMNFESLFDGLEKDDELIWLDTFSPGYVRFILNVEKAVLRGATIRFMVLSPTSPLSTHRAMELGSFYEPDRFKRDLRAFVEDFGNLQTRLLAQNNRNFEVRMYDDTLGCPAYVIRRNTKPLSGHSSLYLSVPTGVNFQHFQWTAGIMLSQLDQYLSKKWDRAKPLASEQSSQNSQTPGDVARANRTRSPKRQGGIPPEVRAAL
ncbi:MAG: hypothetical protein QOJ86_5012 [Bradyrhizobium sp.]|jgi:hypothetical protein|nr:hypothetical protein [Bradyrhizobium sp.]